MADTSSQQTCPTCRGRGTFTPVPGLPGERCPHCPHLYPPGRQATYEEIRAHHEIDLLKTSLEEALDSGSCGPWCGHGKTCHGSEAFAALERVLTDLRALDGAS